ncbi:limbin-like isoform X2 [Hemibagrus wyckioides]|uniref:limbin-like isoform X2 n=1 Tax=Hemibagrus wyckioides TaxID=337641 RepID=UPI00266D3330|nr:limbin-like isoform X2 [Hemibagrus wyckioides]
MRWSHATFSFYCACILLCVARADQRFHDARVLALKPEDNGTIPVPDERGTSGQCLGQRSRSEYLDLNAGSTSIVTQQNEEVALRSAAPEGPWGHSLYALIDQMKETVLRRNYQREPRHTLPQMGSAGKSSEFRVQFQKCAQVVEGSEFPQVRVELEVKNLEGGRDLSQLSIRDTISDIISLQSSGNVQDREYQTFSTDTLSAGSRYVVSYTASVKVSTHEDLFLPAFLTFSSTSPNNISLFRSVVANFTLRINTTEKVCMNHALHFAGFCVAFLISTLLLASTLLTAGCFYKKCLMRAHTYRKRRSFNIEAEPEEAVCNPSDTANEDAAFEDRIIDIMALEDPQNMSPALDNLELSSLLRAAVMLECVRVQMLKGVFRALTAGGSGSGNEVSVVDLLSHVTDMQEDQKSQLNTRSTTEAHSEIQNVEQRRLDALRRREELHAIISEEIEEAAMTGGTHMANQLLHRYYICQDQLESVLDLFIANQRAVLSEQQAQRRFLLQGLQDLQHSMCDMFSAFSRHMDSWFTRIRREGVLSDQHCVHQLERAQSELQRVLKSFEEKLGRERSSAHCDIIRTRRARISETLCEQKCEQQDLVCGSVCDGPLEDYLMRWQTLLCAHNTHLSELITHLDQEAAAHIRRVLVCVLRDAVADLKQVECETSESLQEAGVPRWLLLQLRAGSVVGGILADTEAELGVRKREAAKMLRMTRSRIQTIREQELLVQREKRERMHTYCRSVWESQCSLSESDLLRIQLEYVKSVCHLDCCLVLPHMLSREKGRDNPTNQSIKHTPEYASSNPYPMFTRAQVCVCQNEVCVCEDEMSTCEERVSMQVAAVQWDKLERRNRILETHSALLRLQTLLMQIVSHAPVGEELSHAIHTHSLALEEAELLLQKEESEWERSMDGFGHHKLLTPDEEELFQVNTECMTTECLQEALYKRQQLTHTLTERLTMEIRRQQVMEDLRGQQELKRLYTHFDQDLLLVSLLVKLSGVPEPVLQQLLCLLLPTQPEGELQSLIHTLAPKEGLILGPCCHLVDRLRNDVISKHMAPGSHTHTDRMLKKKQKLVEKLFSRSHADQLGHDSQQPACSLPVTEAATQKEASSSVMGESTPAEMECMSHADEVGVAEEGDMVEEKLFTVHSSPPLRITDASHMPQSHGKRKKFKFKKGTVAPQEQT